ncbi:MAG: hypothetical protein LBJ11_04680 [Oscillospiraceae bacterium]|jgi:hypothetical protein|nr:hypothetical protein [Oscillospiraceae bacterium]
MKKLLASLLALALLLSLFACTPSADGPLTADAWIAKGEKYLLDLDYEQAILAFDEVIKIDPKNPRPWEDKIVAQEMDNDHDGAAQTNQQAQEQVPDFPVIPIDPANPDPAATLPPILKWLEDHGLLDFLQKLLARLAERWPEIALFQTELARVKDLKPQASGAAAEKTTEAPKKKWLLERTDTYNADGTLTSYTTYQYDANGNQTRSDYYFSDGSHNYETYQYDADGKLTRSDDYPSDGSHHYGTYQYDAEGKLTRSDDYPSDGSHSYGTYQYDADGNINRWDSYDSNDNHAYGTRQYDADGKRSRDDYYSSDGSHEYATCQYDANGNISRLDSYDADGKLTGYTLYTYTEA